MSVGKNDGVLSALGISSNKISLNPVREPHRQAVSGGQCHAGMDQDAGTRRDRMMKVDNVFEALSSIGFPALQGVRAAYGKQGQEKELQERIHGLIIDGP